MNYKKQVLRIIDANTNRSKEGLRVCEDIIRLIVEDKRKTNQIKKIRHAVSNIINESIIRKLRIQDYRNSKLDIGKNLKANSKKDKILDIFCANSQRSKEAIRVLEELTLLFDKKASSRFQRLRFNLYNVEKECIKKIRYLCNHRSSSCR